MIHPGSNAGGRRRTLAHWARSRAAWAALAAFATIALAMPGSARAQSADLVVNQADSPDPGPAGGVFTYTVRVDNNGPNPALGVTLSDTLPPGSTFVGVTTTQGSCAHAAGSVTCSLGDLAFLADLTVAIQVVLPSAGVWTNTVTASAATSDPNSANNVNVVETTTAQIAADMTLSVTDTPDPVAAGGNYSYTVTATNQGPNALGGSDVETISFTVPAGACIRSVPTGTGWSCTPSAGYPRCSGAIACTRTGALAVGASAPALTVPAVANVSGTITAAFDVMSTLADGNDGNDTVTATTTITGGSTNVSITKTASASNIAVGANVTYTITPRHNGGEPPGTLAPNLITVTDTLHASLTFVSASGTGWSCSFASPTLTCTRPGPYTGGNFTDMPAIALVVTVTATGTIPNTATVSVPESDAIPGDNSATVNVTGTSTSNLRMTKTVSQSPVPLDSPFSYRLTVRNLGTAAVTATNVITVSDTLPAGLSLTAAPSGTGWSCIVGAPGPYPIAGPVTFDCSRNGPLAVNADAPVITVPVEATSAATLVNNACVALTGTGTSDPTPANDCSSVTVTSTSQSADLEVLSKTASPNPVLAGHDLTYVISVTNHGPDSATNVVVTDALASLVAAGGFQSAMPSQGSCTPSGVTAGPSVTLSCNLGTLNAGAGATIAVVVRPTRATTGGRNNAASIASDIGDPLPSNNTAEVTSTVTAVADVQVTKIASPSPVQAGTPLTYVVTARNNGPSTASTVSISDPLPAGTTFVQLSAVSGGGSCTTPAAGAAGGTITCSWASIANGAQQTATFVVMPQTSMAGSNVDNTVAITTTTIDESPGNDASTTSTPVTAAAVDVLVNKVDSVDPVALGQSTVYTVTVTNGGPSQATNVVLTDAFPAGSPSATFSYQGALSIAPPSIGTCSEPPLGATAGTLGCTFPLLASGQSAVVQYTMRAEAIASGVSGTTFNDASVAADEPETLPANNQTTHATTTRRTADLGIVKTGPASFTPGVAFAWTLTLTNHGPNDSVGAVVTDTLPAGVAFQSASAACTFAAGVVSCNAGTLAAGASVPFTIDVVPATPYAGANPLVNTAGVVTVNEVDPVPGNDTGSWSSTPGPGSADVSIVKTGPASLVAGSPITWQLVVSNAGPSAADGATFADVLPAGVSGATASCGSATGGAVCGAVVAAASSVTGSVAVMPSGSSVTIAIDAIASGAGPIVNTATVAPPPGTNDPVPGNDSSTATTTLTQLPDLVVAKSAIGAFTQGQPASYSLVVTNAGPGTTTAAVGVQDALPAGLTAISISGTGWSCTLSPLGCSRADVLPPGASYPAITLNVDVATSAPASLVNTATVSGGGETNTGNNVSTVTTTVTQVPPDLTIAKAAVGTFAQGQSGASYALIVTNVGSNPTTGSVSVADTLPVGLNATAIAGNGWSCTLTPLSCSRSDALAPSASYPTITVTVDVAATAPANVVNTATVTGGGESNTTNNVATVTTPVTPLPPDVTITKVAGGALVQGRRGATYTLTVTNVGANATTGPVTVTESLPAALTATAMTGAGWSCALATLACTRSDPLAAGSSYAAIIVTVDVSPSATGTIVNIASVTGGGESNTSNNSGTAISTAIAALAATESIPALSPLAIAALALLVALSGGLARRARRR